MELVNFSCELALISFFKHEIKSYPDRAHSSVISSNFMENDSMPNEWCCVSSRVCVCCVRLDSAYLRSECEYNASIQPIDFDRLTFFSLLYLKSELFGWLLQPNLDKRYYFFIWGGKNVRNTDCNNSFSGKIQPNEILMNHKLRIKCKHWQHFWQAHWIFLLLLVGLLFSWKIISKIPFEICK